MPKYKRTKLACYSAYFTMASVFALPPVLLAPLHELYGISYTLLGTLVLVNFFTQMAVDLAFTLFGKRWRVDRILWLMPLITTAGLALYALLPMWFPDQVYAGLVIGTVIFSVSAGLSEVLLSPTIAAIPSDNPQRDMSLLHSLYAFGVFTVVVFSTLFLKVFGKEHWQILTLILAAWPIVAALLFARSPMPDMTATETTKRQSTSKRRVIGLALCFGGIFFGSCAENAMTNWVSGFMETALGIDKALGDVLGLAMFAILLGLSRIAYAKFGKKILPTLLVGMIGAVACYLTVGLIGNVAISFVACILTGVFTSMLWPGMLIAMEENVKGAGVVAFALMAVGGDLGASVAPQMMGVVIDTVAASPIAQTLSQSTGMTADQIGMKAGMLSCAVFPILGVVVLLILMRYFKKNKEQA